MHRTLLGTLALGTLLACDTPTQPAETVRGETAAATATKNTKAFPYEARSLGTLGGENSFGNGMNERGDVIGGADLPSGLTHAFLWRAGQGMQDLGTLGGSQSFATDVNDMGDVVGGSDKTGDKVGRAFLWSEARGMRNLGTLGGPQGSEAIAINNRREIVGGATVPSGKTRAFLWRPRQGMRSLGTLGGPESEAFDINDATQVVGTSLTKSGEAHAFLWSAARGMEDLGTLGGSNSEGRGLSQTGEVVGFSEVPDVGRVEAFLWTRAGGMKSLGSLGGPVSMDKQHPGSIAEAVNTHLRVAGLSDTPDSLLMTEYPTLWTPERGIQRLPTLGGRGNGEFGIAFGINEFGKIAGLSTTAKGTFRATLWTPSNGPLLTAASVEATEQATTTPARPSAEALAALCAMRARRLSSWSRFPDALIKVCRTS